MSQIVDNIEKSDQSGSKILLNSPSKGETIFVTQANIIPCYTRNG